MAKKRHRPSGAGRQRQILMSEGFGTLCRGLGASGETGGLGTAMVGVVRVGGVVMFCGQGLIVNV